jgi:hypothetical protein
LPDFVIGKWVAQGAAKKVTPAERLNLCPPLWLQELADLPFHPRVRARVRGRDNSIPLEVNLMPSPTPSDLPASLPFGRHKGEPLGQVPSHYLAWFLRECKPSTGLRAAVAAELTRRESYVLDGAPYRGIAS